VSKVRKEPKDSEGSNPDHVVIVMPPVQFTPPESSTDMLFPWRFMEFMLFFIGLTLGVCSLRYSYSDQCRECISHEVQTKLVPISIMGSVPQDDRPKSSRRSLFFDFFFGSRVTKHALLITCTYKRPKDILKATYTDGQSMKKYLQGEGFEVTWMHDHKYETLNGKRGENGKRVKNYDEELFPSTENLKEKLTTFAEKCKPGDVLWVHFSGHGARVADSDDSEVDGKDEALRCPNIDGRDKNTSKHRITDDWLYDEFVCKIQSGVEVIFVSDSCHSGSILDLPYSYDNDEKEFVTNPNVCEDTKADLDEDVKILCISGCKDDEHSRGNIKTGGYLTRCLLDFIEESEGRVDVGELAEYFVENVDDRQTPQISCSVQDPGSVHIFDCEQPEESDSEESSEGSDDTQEDSEESPQSSE